MVYFVPVHGNPIRYPYYIKRKELQSWLDRQKKDIKFNSVIIYLALSFINPVLPLIFLAILRLNGENVPWYIFPCLLLFFVISLAFLTYDQKQTPITEEKIKELMADKDEMVTINSDITNHKISGSRMLYIILWITVLGIGSFLPLLYL